MHDAGDHEYTTFCLWASLGKMVPVFALVISYVEDTKTFVQYVFLHFLKRLLSIFRESILITCRYFYVILLCLQGLKGVF